LEAGALEAVVEVGFCRGGREEAEEGQSNHPLRSIDTLAARLLTGAIVKEYVAGESE
jgi:hypothetical protein